MDPERLLPLAWVGCGVLVAAAFQSLVYRIEFGSLTRVPYLIEGATAGRATSFDWLHPQVGPVLFSGFHGLFAWHPLILLAMAGGFLAARKHLQLIGLLLAFCLQAYVISSWYEWWQGASFGGRMFSSCSFGFVVGLAGLWSLATT